MAHPITSRKKSLLLSGALFFIGLIAIAMMHSLWPGIMLAIGLPLALRQYLLGKTHDTIITLFVFGGTFLTVAFDIQWELFLPVLFALGAFYVLIRELFSPDPITEEEIEENTEQEIEDK